MTRNPFRGMVDALTAAQPDKPVSKPRPKHMENLAVPPFVRALIIERGPMACAQIADELGIAQVDVSRQLRPSVHNGRLARTDIYAMCEYVLVRAPVDGPVGQDGPVGPDGLDAQAQRVVAELQRLGYLVLRPGRSIANNSRRRKP